MLESRLHPNRACPSGVRHSRTIGGRAVVALPLWRTHHVRGFA